MNTPPSIEIAGKERMMDTIDMLSLHLNKVIDPIFGIESTLGERIVAGTIAAILVTIIVKLVSAILSEIWMHIAKKHDASALAYLGDDEDSVKFANASIFPDSPRYMTIAEDIIPYNDPRDVIGFIINKPLRLERGQSYRQGWRSLKIEETGYYAYILINWEMYEQVRIWTDRGYGLQKSATLNEKGEIDESRVDNRQLLISPLNEDGKYVYHICEGPIRLFRWQPYKKFGFESERINIYRLSILAKCLIWVHRIIGKLASWICKIYRSIMISC